MVAVQDAHRQAREAGMVERAISLNLVERSVQDAALALPRPTVPLVCHIGRATPGTQRTTTVNSTPPMSWSSPALPA
jgi:hypothetical protein